MWPHDSQAEWEFQHQVRSQHELEQALRDRLAEQCAADSDEAEVISGEVLPTEPGQLPTLYQRVRKALSRLVDIMDRAALRDTPGYRDEMRRLYSAHVDNVIVAMRQDHLTQLQATKVKNVMEHGDRLWALLSDPQTNPVQRHFLLGEVQRCQHEMNAIMDAWLPPRNR